MSNVIEWGGVTSLPLDPDKVLNGAIGRLSEVLVIGYQHDGSIYFAASNGDGGDVIWLMEKCRHMLLGVGE